MQQRHEGSPASPGLAWVAIQANLAEYVWPLDATAEELQSLQEQATAESASAQDVLLLACFQHPGRHGFELVCMDPPAATLAAAGPGAQDWGPAEWEGFERSQPLAFASVYEFWFVAGRR